MEVLTNISPHLSDPLVTTADFEKLRNDVDVDKEPGYVYEAIT